jgi:hypothetical protein
MADIFISYSKLDRDLALKLSASLESEGWSVWWGKSLAPGDTFRDEIMKQLASTRAVITIWTKNSINSDWVRAEAGRAKADGKLIPVKSPDVGYPEIPLPFGEMHTENITSTDLIRAAIVSLLTKPATPAPPFWQLTSAFRGEFLTWCGIVGGALTLFTNLRGVVDLARWAAVLVQYWHDWAAEFWSFLFGWIGIRIPRELAPIFSFTVFSAMLMMGTNLRMRFSKQQFAILSSSQLRRKIMTVATGIVLYSLLVVALIATWALVDKIAERVPSLELVGIAVEYLALLGTVFGFPVGFTLYVTDENRLWIGLAWLLFGLLGICLLLPLLANTSWDSGPVVVLAGVFTILCLFQLCGMAVILFSPVRPLTYRLGFLVIGVVILITLSEISKLSLDQYLQPPKAFIYGTGWLEVIGT